MKRLILGLLLLLANFAAMAAMKIHYTVSFANPQTHYCTVQMHVTGAAGNNLRIQMPVWAPGSYLIREFEKSVENLHAAAGSKVLPVAKTDKNTWQITTNGAADVTITYDVYAYEVSVRTSYIDATHAFLSPTSIFMYPEKQLQLPSTVTIVPHRSWTTVSTGMEAVAGKPYTYAARNYDWLFDSPIEVGTQEVIKFKAGNTDYEVAMYSKANYNVERIAADFTKIINEQVKLFGENPNKRYVVICHNLQQGSGGLEHLNSQTIGVSKADYDTESGYKGILSLFSHEHFHLWNVKRLRPIALGPFNYNTENYTRSLWISEGITSYYQNKFMLKAGLITAEEFSKINAGTLSTIMNTPGNKVTSAAQSSFDAWILQYRPNENSVNNMISYYTKGGGLGFLFDLEIANATKGAKCLDDVMREMYYFCKQKGRGFKDEEFKQCVERVRGKSFTDIYNKYVEGTADIDYKALFNMAGLTAVQANPPSLGLGIRSRMVQGKALVTAVLRPMPAWQAGISAGDLILAVNNNSQYMAGDLKNFNGKASGDKVILTIIRNGEQLDVGIPLAPDMYNNAIQVTPAPAKGAVQQAVYTKVYGAG